jgi:hypothetical protein
MMMATRSNQQHILMLASSATDNRLVAVAALIKNRDQFRYLINASWTDRNGKTAAIGIDDILIITPYNAQVFEIIRRLPDARVGTVDKFQGQEAPIAIYSMATSSHEPMRRAAWNSCTA